MSRGVVLITGINGFLGTYTALAFLDAGYTVKGTGRTAAKAADWIAHFPAHKASYQSVVVTDFGALGAFDDAVKGCDIIVHVASPNSNPQSQDNEADMLIPAINGTRNLLVSTKLEPRIRRVVFTSTLGAVVEPSQPEPGRVYTEKDWNPSTYEEAKASTNPRFVYGVSKALAERAFWEYVETEKPVWAGAVILPCGVFDPPIQPLTSLAAINRSVGFFWDIARGKYKAGLTIPATHAFHVSARDTAQAHLLAAERDAAKNQRYILVGGSYDADEIIDIITRHFPALRDNLPPRKGFSEPPSFGFDTSKTQTDLGITCMPFEKIVVDTIGGCLELEEKLKA
ncbi:NAD-P-binding protein [Mycena capillaripes]|nr:NAD-P-binding protein [Mycena capillaripes]